MKISKKEEPSEKRRHKKGRRMKKERREKKLARSSASQSFTPFLFHPSVINLHSIFIQHSSSSFLPFLFFHFISSSFPFLSFHFIFLSFSFFCFVLLTFFVWPPFPFPFFPFSLFRRIGHTINRDRIACQVACGSAAGHRERLKSENQRRENERHRTIVPRPL